MRRRDDAVGFDRPAALCHCATGVVCSVLTCSCWSAPVSPGVVAAILPGVLMTMTGGWRWRSVCEQ